MSRMTSHSILVAIFTVSYVAISIGSHVNTTIVTYPARVFNTTQGECLSGGWREMVIAEVKENIRNLLPQFMPIRKWYLLHHIYLYVGMAPTRNIYNT